VTIELLDAEPPPARRPPPETHRKHFDEGCETLERAGRILGATHWTTTNRPKGDGYEEVYVHLFATDTRNGGGMRWVEGDEITTLAEAMKDVEGKGFDRAPAWSVSSDGERMLLLTGSRKMQTKKHHWFSTALYELRFATGEVRLLHEPDRSQDGYLVDVSWVDEETFVLLGQRSLRWMKVGPEGAEELHRRRITEGEQLDVGTVRDDHGERTVVVGRSTQKWAVWFFELAGKKLHPLGDPVLQPASEVRIHDGDALVRLGDAWKVAKLPAKKGKVSRKAPKHPLTKATLILAEGVYAGPPRVPDAAKEALAPEALHGPRLPRMCGPDRAATLLPGILRIWTKADGSVREVPTKTSEPLRFEITGGGERVFLVERNEDHGLYAAMYLVWTRRLDRDEEWERVASGDYAAAVDTERCVVRRDDAMYLCVRSEEGWKDVHRLKSSGGAALRWVPEHEVLVVTTMSSIGFYGIVGEKLKKLTTAKLPPAPFSSTQPHCYVTAEGELVVAAKDDHVVTWKLA